jgi:hypothetical protein
MPKIVEKKADKGKAKAKEKEVPVLSPAEMAAAGKNLKVYTSSLAVSLTVG